MMDPFDRKAGVGPARSDPDDPPRALTRAHPGGIGHGCLHLFCLILLLVSLSGLRCGSRCGDGLDNDSDGYIDYPDDPGCWDLTANREGNQNYGCCEVLDPPQCLEHLRVDSCGENTFYPDTTCLDAGCVAATPPVECEPSDPHLQLTYENSAQYFPHYSADGSRLVYRSTEDGGLFYDIWMMNSDGTDHVQLTTEDHHQDSPFFSPDGRRIAYISLEDAGHHYDIWVMDSDGSNRVQLTTEEADQLSPTYSPDGKRIVYSSTEDGDVHHDIWAIDCTGGIDPAQCDPQDDHVQLTTEDFDQGFPNYHPSGGEIVYNSLEDGGDHMDIWVMESDGSNHVQLTTEDQIQNRASYSPDGSKIVYGSREDGGLSTDIWIMDADGSDHVQLTTEGVTQRGSRFSPDGTKIVYRAREDAGSYMDVWIVDCAGTVPERLPGDPYASANVVSTELCGQFNTITIEEVVPFGVDDYVLLDGEPDTCLVVVEDSWGWNNPVVSECPAACENDGCGVAEFYLSTEPPLPCGGTAGGAAAGSGLPF